MEKKLFVMVVLLTACGADRVELGQAHSGLTPAVPHYAFDIRERLSTSDCNPATGVCNLTTVLRTVLDECNESPPVNNAVAGCSIHIPAGEYQLDEPVVLCRQHRIYGDGGLGWGARTLIHVAPETTAFRVAYKDECENAATTPRRNPVAGGPPTNLPGGGSWSEIVDLGIESDGCGSACSGVPHHGVQMQARAQLRNLFIRGFTHGVHISADVNRAAFGTANLSNPEADNTRSNSNLWHLDSLRIDNCDHAGVFVEGGDSNAGLGEMVDSSSNCQEPAAGIALWGDCANIIDRSYLGSTWVATHTTANSATASTHPGYLSDGDNQRSVFVGAYAEMNQDPSQLGKKSNAIGGLANWGLNTNGLRIEGPRFVGRLFIENNTNPNNRTSFDLGNIGNGVFYAARSENMNRSWPLRLASELRVASDAPALCTASGANPLNECTRYQDSMANGAACSECLDGWYRFDVANLGTARALRIDGSDNGDGPRGELWLREPFTVGNFDPVCPSNPDNVCP